ncbi:MAG TPA: trypsin-like peptidase domain-containing protein [Herpetosiphonaceae bacterium]
MRLSPLILVGALVLSACGGAPSTDAPSSSPSAVVSSPSAAPSAAPEATSEPTASPAATTMNNEEIAEKLRPSTIRVVAEFGETAIQTEGLGAGTGIVYNLDDGLIITNAHVVEGASVVKIALADSTRTRSARVVGRSQCDDLAVLKVENTEGLQEATLGESSSMKAGAEVVALGYPLSFDLGNDISVNPGSISQLNAQLSKFENLIKTDAAINPGNSGGPLVNRKGEVIGVNSLGIPDAQNTNYAIAMSQAKPIVAQLEEGKNRHFIGLNLVPNEYADYFGTDEGMAIIGVASGSPASQVGIQPADLLVKMEGKSITDEAAVCDILRSHADGDQLKVTVYRASTGEVLEGEMTMGKVGAADDKTAKLEVIGNLADSGGDQGEPPASDEPSGDSGEPTSDEGNLIVNNSFDDNDPGTWPVGEEDGYSAQVADGVYTLSLATDNLYLFLHPDESADFADGAIAAQVRPEGDGLAGIMGRYTEVDGNRSMYVCWINNERKFACSKDVNNSWTVMVETQTSDVIQPDNYNKVVLAIVGNEFSFQVNDQELASFTDDSLTNGAWGVYAETTPGNFKAHYDHIAVAVSE